MNYKKYDELRFNYKPFKVLEKKIIFSIPLHLWTGECMSFEKVARLPDTYIYVHCTL